MATETEMLDQVQNEVKKFGDNVKELKNTFEKDLHDLREVVSSTKTTSESEKKQFQELASGMAAKHDAIQKVVEDLMTKATKNAERADELERKLNRSRLGGGAGAEDVEVKSAIEFTRTRMSLAGNLRVDSDVTAENVDVKSIAEYGNAFNRYARKGDAALSGDEKKAMLVGDDTNGGFLVPTAYSSRIQGIVYETSPIRSLATVETIGTDSWEYPIDEDEASGGWVGETSARPETSTPKVGTGKIVVHELYANPKVTQKILEDASVNIESWLSGKIGEKFGRIEATAHVAGDGSSKPRGLLTYPTGTTRGTIEQVNLGSATDVTADGLVKMMIALKDPYSAGSVWLMRRTTIGNVMLLKDTTGQYIWKPGLDAGKPSSLLAHPIYQAADMPAVAGGALSLIFGNIKQAYTIVDRLGITTLRDPFTAKPWVMFYTRRRTGGDVVNFEALKIGKIST